MEIFLSIIIVKFLPTIFNIFSIICPKIFTILFFNSLASQTDRANLTYTMKPKPINFKSMRQNLNWSDLKNPNRGKNTG